MFLSPLKFIEFVSPTFLGGLIKSVSKFAAPLISGAFGYAGQEAANSASVASTREQMDFQREMSSTAYQRAVKDMRKAGLNPMLAYSQGGASSPSGSSVKFENSNAAAVQAAQASAQLQNIQSQTELNSAQATKAKVEADKVRTETPERERFLEKYEREITAIARSSNLTSAQYNNVLELTKNAKVAHGQIVANTKNQYAQAALAKVNKLLRKYEAEGAKNTATFEKTVGAAGNSEVRKMALEILKLMFKNYGR